MRDSQEASNINRYLSKSYIVCNSLLQYNIQDSKAFLTIQVYNIFNAKYADFLGAEMPGRWISAGIKFII